jgi:hypothetical protein
MPRGQKPKVYDSALVDAVSRLYAEKKTQAEIASALGMSQKVIWNVIRRHGLKARIAAKREQRGTANSYWKGNDAGKQALHRRLYAKYGKPTKCAECGTTEAKHYDYANLTGHYEDINDYKPMCRSCHAKYDARQINFRLRQKGGA